MKLSHRSGSFFCCKTEKQPTFPTQTTNFSDIKHQLFRHFKKKTTNFSDANRCLALIDKGFLKLC